jgi:hypothetical protein
MGYAPPGQVVLIVILLVGLYALALLPRAWRGSFPPRIERQIDAPTLRGARVRASVRALPSTAVFLLTFSVAFVILGFVSATSLVGDVVLAVALLAAVVYGVLVGPLTMLNRPKCLVPPRLRDGPGFLDDLRSSDDAARPNTLGP